MRLPRVLFTIREMMIAIGLLALFMRGGWLLGYSVIVAVRWLLSRRRNQKLGGGLLLQVVRPFLKRLETAAFVIYAICLATSLGYLVLIGVPVGASPLDTVFFIYTWVGFLYWPCFRWRRIEFRERG